MEAGSLSCDKETQASQPLSDLQTGRSELWQVIKPKDQVALRPMVNAVAITPDSRWMAYQYGTRVSQLYVSETLK